MDVETLIDLLPLSLHLDPEDRRVLVAMLTPVATVDQLLDARTRALSELVDPEAAPEAIVRHLAALVGLGSELGAANALTTEQLRRLIPVAVALWKIKGTRESWRSLVASLAGSRCLILDWFYFRTVDGSPAMVHTIPAAGELGDLYSYPELVSDVWIADPSGTLDTAPLVRFLDVARPAGERINLYVAHHVDDLGAAANLWQGFPSGGSWSYDSEAWELSTHGIFLFGEDLDGMEADLSNYAAFMILRVTGIGEVQFLHATPLDLYRLVIDVDAATVALNRVVGGISTVLASKHRVLVAGFPYRWTIEALDGPGPDATIRVTWEGVTLIEVTDTLGGRPKKGPLLWGSVSPTSSTTLSALILRSPFPPSWRIGPNP